MAGDYAEMLFWRWQDMGLIRAESGGGYRVLRRGLVFTDLPRGFQVVVPEDWVPTGATPGPTPKPRPQRVPQQGTLDTGRLPTWAKILCISKDKPRGYEHHKPMLPEFPKPFDRKPRRVNPPKPKSPPGGKLVEIPPDSIIRKSAPAPAPAHSCSPPRGATRGTGGGNGNGGGSGLPPPTSLPPPGGMGLGDPPPYRRYA